MAITLTSGNDTFYLYEMFLGGTSKSSLAAVKGQSIDGGAGTDTLVLEYAWPDSNFSLAVGDTGIVTVSAASGSVTFSNFEKFKYTNLTISTGTTGNDAVTGGPQSDHLYGLAGNDRLNGSGGVDTMLGGAGNDTYVVDNPGDSVRETTTMSGSTDAGGLDLVQSSIGYALGAFVENLALTGTAAIDGTGNALANRLSGNGAANALSGADGNDTLAGGAGNDTLSGGAGNDQLDGGTGADVLRGGAGNDTYVVDHAGDAVDEATVPGGATDAGGKDLVKSSVGYTLGTLLESLVLTGSSAIDGTGNARANALSGNAAANLLQGGGGADTLNGGAGHDTLAGGAGADTFVFGSPLDALANVDVIADWGAGGAQDRIFLDDDVFLALGPVAAPTALAAAAFVAGTAAVDADDRIVYDASSGALYYDPDGTGAAAQVQFATIGTATHPALTAADFLVVA